MITINYRDIIDSSTDTFQDKHLILDDGKRNDLELDILRIKRPFFDEHHESTFSQKLFDACSDEAKRRFTQLHRNGFYRTNQSGNNGQGCPRKSTIIISETILLHITQAHRGNGDLLFQIKETTALKRHLSICHFNAFPWRQDEDALLKEGFEKYRNKRIVDTLEENERNEENILSLIKNEFFATSTKTKEDLKYRARTLGLKISF